MAKVKEVNLKSQLVLGVREIGHYQKIKELLTKLFPYALSRGVKIDGHPIFICHETAQEAIEAAKEGTADIEVCVPVKERIEIDSEGRELGVACYELPGGKFAKTIHKGPYEDCQAIYEELFQWIAEHGYRIIGPTREYYLNDPNQVAPSQIKTEIYAPIEKGREVRKLYREVK